MDVGALANEWLGNYPVAEGPIYRGPDDHWLYDLPAGALYELPAPVRNVVPAASPRLGRADWQAGVPDEPAYIRVTRPTMENDLYGDPLTRLALGQSTSYGANTYDAAANTWSQSPYAGTDTPEQISLASLGWREGIGYAQQALFNPFRALTVPPMTTIGTTPRVPGAPAPAATLAAALSNPLVLGMIALAVVFLVRR